MNPEAGYSTPGEGEGPHGVEGESTAHGQGDLCVFAQQAHVGLDKGEIFFLHVGRVSGEPGQHCRALCYLRRTPRSPNTQFDHHPR